MQVPIVMWLLGFIMWVIAGLLFVSMTW